MQIAELRLVFGANVRRRRIECNLSQKALGELVSLSDAQINRIENGLCSTPIDFLAKISIPLKWEPAFFLTPSSSIAEDRPKEKLKQPA